MADGRRTFHVLSVLAVVAAVVSSSASVATADDPKPSRQLSATVHRVPVTTVEQVVTPTADVTAKLANDRFQQASAFTLQVGGQWKRDDTLRPVPRDRLGLPVGVMDSITWLATQYYNLPDRITVERGPGDFDTSPESAAYQLAIWSFSDRRNVDLAVLPETVVTRRARVLAAAAAESAEPDRSSPIAEATLTLSVDEEYFEGTRFRAHLEENAPADANLQDQLVLFTVDDEPVRVVQTDRNGNAFLDLPHRARTLGDVQAAWTTQLAQGTVFDGPGGAVILYQPLPAVLESEVLAHARRGWEEYPGQVAGLALRQLESVHQGVAITVVLGTLLVGGVLVQWVTTRFEGRRLPQVAVSAIGCLLLLGVVGGGLSKLQAREFHAEWAARPAVEEAGAGRSTAPAAIEWVAETSSYQGQHPGFFSARCAFDGVARTAWLSGRNRGTGQFLVVGFAEPVLITRIDVVPGWFDTKQNHDLTGKPSDLLVFNEFGIVSRHALPEGRTFEAGPRVVTLTLQEPLPASQLYVMITRIEGDTRTYAAIGEITVVGSPIEGPMDSTPTIDREAVEPEVTEAAACAASD